MRHVTVVLLVPNIEANEFIKWLNGILDSCANWYNTTYDILFIAGNNTNQGLKDFLKYAGENPPFWFHTIYVDESLHKAEKYNIGMFAAKNEGKGSPCLALLEYPYAPSRGWIYPPIQLLSEDQNVCAVGGAQLSKDGIVKNTGWIYDDKGGYSPYLNMKKEYIPKKIYEERSILCPKCLFINSIHFNGFKNVDGFIDEFCSNSIFKNLKLIYTPKLELKSIHPEYIDVDDHPVGLPIHLINTLPIVGIIMPCYNSQKYLQDVLCSFREQTYQLWKLFFIDDCSTDTSKHIFNTIQDLDNSYLKNKTLTPRLDSRFEMHNLVKNIGVSGARNIARDTILYHRPYIDLIAYCDSDDKWSETHLEEMVLEFIKYPETDFIYSDVITKFDNGEPAFSYGIPYHVELDKYRLKSENPIYISTVMHKRYCLTVGKFDERITGIEDWLYWNQIAKAGYNMYHLPRKLTTYTVKKDGGMAATNNDEKSMIFQEEIKKLYSNDKEAL